MTTKLFWEDPYQTTLDSYVISLEHNTIELSETIFYAESGGQESDAGTINGVEVVTANKKGNRIYYTLATPPPFTVGSLVTTKINWPRRYSLMKLHFAAELILESFYKKYTIEKIGAHISEEKSRIDFLFDGNITPLLNDIQTSVQALINADLPINSDFSDIAAEQRYWKINQFAQVPCGGTHLRRTSEIGTIQLKRKNIGKGKERVEITIE
ncbi:alanyl-tRNA editing protein [Celerinatantimonas sp. YJH-8]|uniref:alanyl-tRNA editing protein n=1 Tax=Celerinatantimonas sp. YJH-8 TaxID=3228714 RepID=UPI0038C690B6